MNGLFPQLRKYACYQYALSGGVEFVIQRAVDFSGYQFFETQRFLQGRIHADGEEDCRIGKIHDLYCTIRQRSGTSSLA